MKKIFFIILLITSLFSSEKKDTIALGMGLYTQTQPYTSTSTNYTPSPVVFYDNGIFYMRWTRVGIYFLGKKSDEFSWGLSLSMQPVPYGYDANGIDLLSEKKDTYEGGLALSMKKGKTSFELLAFNDLLGRYNSYRIESELGYKYDIGQVSFYPSMFLNMNSRKFSQYYYGTNSYNLKKSYEYGIQTYIQYPLTKEFSLFLNLKADRLSNSIIKSPIVKDSYIYSALVSFLYKIDF